MEKTRKTMVKNKRRSKSNITRESSIKTESMDIHSAKTLKRILMQASDRLEGEGRYCQSVDVERPVNVEAVLIGPTNATLAMTKSLLADLRDEYANAGNSHVARICTLAIATLDMVCAGRDVLAGKQEFDARKKCIAANASNWQVHHAPEDEAKRK